MTPTGGAAKSVLPHSGVQQWVGPGLEGMPEIMQWGFSALVRSGTPL